MRALVVYESMFGNTREIAEAVTAGLAERMKTELVEVNAAPDVLPAGIDLLVVGGPTHAFGMSRQATRRDAARQLAAGAQRPGAVDGAEGTGIREWLTRVEFGQPAPVAAVFDTKVRSPLPGSASVKAARLLRRRGVRVVGRRSFFVTGTRGPLGDGERRQARGWAADVAAWRLEPSSGGNTTRTAA